MTASTEILPFAEGGSANVLSQAAYAALTSMLANGFPSGILPSTYLNKVLRQSTFMAAGLAAFCVAQGVSVPDDGNLTNLVSELTTALQTLNGKSVVGAVRNGKMSVTTASATATYTADELVVETTLGGTQYQLSSYNKPVNLATTGAGGMDTGAAPASGYVALYAIYGSSGTSILAVDTTASVAPAVYGGAHMPAGYTASALISVWPTNGSGQFVVGQQQDRTIGISGIAVLATTTNQASYTALSISGAVPKNAKTTFGSIGVITSSTGGSSVSFNVSPDANGVGGTGIG